MLTSSQMTDVVHALERGPREIRRNGVYTCRLEARSQAAVDAWRQGVNSLYEQAGYGTTLTLTDARRSILPPLAYAAILSGLWTGHLHRRLHSRNAILCDEVPTPAAQAALHALPGYGNNVIRFFASNDRQAALHWLVMDD